jgi:hypothetical protein
MNNNQNKDQINQTLSPRVVVMNPRYNGNQHAASTHPECWVKKLARLPIFTFNGSVTLFVSMFTRFSFRRDYATVIPRHQKGRLISSKKSFFISLQHIRIPADEINKDLHHLFESNCTGLRLISL